MFSCILEHFIRKFPITMGVLPSSFKACSLEAKFFLFFLLFEGPFLRLLVPCLTTTPTVLLHFWVIVQRIHFIDSFASGINASFWWIWVRWIGRRHNWLDRLRFKENHVRLLCDQKRSRMSRVWFPLLLKLVSIIQS